MKKEKILLSIATTTFAFSLGIGVFMSGSPLPKINASGEGPIYSLNLNNKKINKEDSIFNLFLTDFIRLLFHQYLSVVNTKIRDYRN